MKIQAVLRPLLFTFAALLAVGLSAQTTLKKTQSARLQKAEPVQRVEAQKTQATDLVKVLDLTPDQMAQYEALEAERLEKVAALKADTNDDEELRRNKVYETNTYFNNKLYSILTDEQRKKMKEMQLQRQSPNGERN